MVPVVAVANEFLNLAREENCPIDQMKLQKLVFYAQAWWLAFNDESELFPEDINAWKWGPVIPEIYNQTKLYGRDPITDLLRSVMKIDDDLNFEWKEAKIGDDNTEEKELIKAVWDTHKEYSGIQLSNSTHASGEPLTIIREKYNGDLSKKPNIPIDIIRAVFKSKRKNSNE